jgi:hypothetical protein
LRSFVWAVNQPTSAALAQLVRAPDCGSGGPWFETRRWYHLPLHSDLIISLYGLASQFNCEVIIWVGSNKDLPNECSP